MKITKATLSKNVILPVSTEFGIKSIPMKKDDCIHLDLDSIDGDTINGFIRHKNETYAVEFKRDEYIYTS